MIKYFLKYLVFVGVSYVIYRKIEKICLKSLKLKNDVDAKTGNLVIDTDKKDILNTGGEKFLAVTGMVGNIPHEKSHL
jgi:hypothetical protein